MSEDKHEDAPVLRELQWDEEVRDGAVNRLMELCADLRKYRGFMLITMNSDGDVSWSYSGAMNQFTQFEVLGLMRYAENRIMIGLNEATRSDNDD